MLTGDMPNRIAFLLIRTWLVFILSIKMYSLERNVGQLVVVAKKKGELFVG